MQQIGTMEPHVRSNEINHRLPINGATFPMAADDLLNDPDQTST